MKVFKSAWWEIRLVNDWIAEPDEECVTISQPDGAGALQISAYQKQSHKISRVELLELMELDTEAQRHLSEQEWGEFSGFQLVYSEGEDFWRKWWLCNCGTLLFITYTCDLKSREAEQNDINQMMCSLKRLPA